MLFNSYIFILLLLPLTVSGYFLLNKVFSGKGYSAGNYWLLFMSLWFYGYGNVRYLLILLLSGSVNYILCDRIYKLKKRDVDTRHGQTGLLVTGVLFQLGLLFYFKYTNFFMDTIYGIMNKQWEPMVILLPVGISFIIFSQISYIADCYRDEEGFKDSLLTYMLWLSFFPKISSGPIILREELIDQFNDRGRKDINYTNLSRGLYEFSQGLAKKVLLADSLAKIINAGFGEMASLSGIWVWFLLLAYTLQLYFDFSGYCDMGLGIAKMMNFELTMNFNSPYKSKSVTEFWSRWHMSLTRFFTKYIYIPLGGNRKGKLRTYGNTLFVFLLSGLWHGASWTFILWGAIHGIFMTAEKIIKDIVKDRKVNLPGFVKKMAGAIYMIIFLCISWGIFRASSMEEVKAVMGKMFSFSTQLPGSVAEAVNDLIEIRVLGRLGLSGLLEAYPMLPGVAAILIMFIFVLFCKNTQQKAKEDKYNSRRSFVTIILLIWCIISLSDVSTFLYFEF